MKRIILSSIVAASLAVSCFAEGEVPSSSKKSFYVGVGYGSMSADHTTPHSYDYTTTYEYYGNTDFSSSIESKDLDVDAKSIKFGIDANSYRLEVGYSKVSAKGTKYYNYSGSTGTVDEKFTGIDFDFIKPFTNNALKPYLSVGAGYYSWDDYKVSYGSGNENVDRKGISYNLGAGLLYSIGSVEFDIAYKWKKINWDDVITTMYTSSGTQYATRTYYDEETTITGLYAGINFHF